MNHSTRFVIQGTLQKSFFPDNRGIEIRIIGCFKNQECNKTYLEGKHKTEPHPRDKTNLSDVVNWRVPSGPLKHKLEVRKVKNGIYAERRYTIRSGNYGVQINLINSKNVAMAEIGCEDKGINFDWISIKRTSLKNPKMYFFNVAEILNAIPSDNYNEGIVFYKTKWFSDVYNITVFSH